MVSAIIQFILYNISYLIPTNVLKSKLLTNYLQTFLVSCCHLYITFITIAF